jgi:hypothetical protein
LSLVRKVLVQRADRDAGLLGDLAHLQRVAAALRDQLLGHRQDALEPLVAALLRRLAARRRHCR